MRLIRKKKKASCILWRQKQLASELFHVVWFLFLMFEHDGFPVEREKKS